MSMVGFMGIMTVHCTPISGTGFYTLNRAEYKVLGVYNQFGNSQKSKQILSNMGIDKTTQNKVLEIFQELNKW